MDVGGLGQGFGQWPPSTGFGLMALIAFVAGLLPLVAGLAAGLYLAFGLHDRR